MMKYIQSIIVVGLATGLCVVTFGALMRRYDVVDLGFQILFGTAMAGVPLVAGVAIYAVFHPEW